MNKEEEEADDNQIYSQITIGIKKEPDEMEVGNSLFNQDIKQEPELIIKSELEWSPTKLEDEQQEYYLEYQCNKVEHDDEYEVPTTQSDPKEFEEFSIKYVDENEWEDGDNDDHDENYDDDKGDNSNEDYTEYDTSDEDVESKNYSEQSSDPGTKSKKAAYVCPLCSAFYTEFNYMRFHFIDKHPNEYGELFSYHCHLCENTDRNFNNDQEFFKHLLEEHNLKDWSLMNFDFYPKNSDDPHFLCTKCFKIFTEIDLIEFLRHYLEHSNSYRVCRSCNNKYSLKLINFYHMCHGWFDKFQNRAVKLNIKQRTALSCWQEFEEYIMHTCSFCNKEFENLIAWQIHLKEIHHSDTLKGLQMEKIPNESDRLKCNTCNAFVPNSSADLHTHRFQHLPYEPYKCRHCSRTFANYKLALNHVLKKCQDQDDQTEAATVEDYQEIICPLCDTLWFRNEKDIVEHFIGAHNNFRGYYTKQLDNSMKCNVCQLRLANEDKKCRHHILLHFAQKSYKCFKCSQSFPTKEACTLHLGFHLAKPIKTQKKSENKFFVKATFRKGSAIKEQAEFLSYACPECNESFENKPLWQEHINEKHDFFQEDNLAIKDPLDGTLKCSHCHMKFGGGGPVRRKRHKLLHMTYKAFICKICNYRGCTLSYMYTHLRSKHFAKGSFKSSHCPLKVPPGVVERQKHKLTHMPNKAFVCKLCSQSFSFIASLQTHLRRVHFAKGLLKCPICPLILTTSHEKTEHLENAHPRSEWPGLMCRVCCTTLANRSSLTVHMRAHKYQMK